MASDALDVDSSMYAKDNVIVKVSFYSSHIVVAVMYCFLELCSRALAKI